MPKLSLIESEAVRFVGHMPEAKRRMLQDALINLCETHWPEIRGPEPDMPLARALWQGAPPLADLLADLYAAGDERLEGVLQGRKPAQGFALLALAEIERGDAEGARLAHEPMMLFDSPSAGTLYAEGIAAALRGTRTALQLHLHESKPALWKALASIAAHTGRCDLNAALRVIGLLAARAAPDQTTDEALEHLRVELDRIGIRFLGIDDHHVGFEVHGHEHKPASTTQLGEMLAEIRLAWLK